MQIIVSTKTYYSETSILLLKQKENIAKNFTKLLDGTWKSCLRQEEFNCYMCAIGCDEQVLVLQEARDYDNIYIPVIDNDYAVHNFGGIGRASGVSFKTKEGLISALFSDLEKFGLRPRKVESHSELMEDEVRIAFFYKAPGRSFIKKYIPGEGFHFLRQSPIDDNWYHKKGWGNEFESFETGFIPHEYSYNGLKFVTYIAISLL